MHAETKYAYVVVQIGINNPFTLSELFYYNSLDQSISNSRVSG